MLNLKPYHDKALIDHFGWLSASDDDFWSFKGNAQREFGHGLLQYPAMMVPQMVRALLDICCTVHPDIQAVGDPFAGSGTVLTESMIKGMNFWGSDINPLAILACKVKSGPFCAKTLSKKTIAIKKNLNIDNNSCVDIDFKGIDKWFEKDIQIEISKIRRCIKKEKELWVRRFFWITLAETIRSVSNSRTSTFKLHIRTREDILKRNIDVIETFIKNIDRNIELLSQLEKKLNENNLLEEKKYINKIEIQNTDTRNIYDRQFESDIIITSPPYGDNATTVPYGQYSYLPLHWIDLNDIDSSINPHVLETTHTIDSSSLGGKKNMPELHEKSLCARAPSLGIYLNSIQLEPPDRKKRVLSFIHDFDVCIPKILSQLSVNGIIILVLGNRKVGGKRVPFDDITIELMKSHGANLVHKIQRRIPSKRMAVKNNFSDTMSKESIIVMRNIDQEGGHNGRY